MIDVWQVFLDFVASLMAGIIGVVLGFEIDRWRETQRDKVKAIEFLALIKEEMSENLGTSRLVSTAIKEIPRISSLPHYGFQFGVWRALSERIALIRNNTLRLNIIKAYAFSEEIERMMTRYLDLGYDLETEPNKDSDGYKELSRTVWDLRDVIIKHSAIMQDILASYMSEIDVETSKLKDC